MTAVQRQEESDHVLQVNYTRRRPADDDDRRRLVTTSSPPFTVTVGAYGNRAVGTPRARQLVPLQTLFYCFLFHGIHTPDTTIRRAPTRRRHILLPTRPLTAGPSPLPLAHPRGSRALRNVATTTLVDPARGSTAIRGFSPVR